MIGWNALRSICAVQWLKTSASPLMFCKLKLHNIRATRSAYIESALLKVISELLIQAAQAIPILKLFWAMQYIVLHVERSVIVSKTKQTTLILQILYSLQVLEVL